MGNFTKLKPIGKESEENGSCFEGGVNGYLNCIGGDAVISPRRLFKKFDHVKSKLVFRNETPIFDTKKPKIDEKEKIKSRKI